MPNHSSYSLENQSNKLVTASEYACWHGLDVFDTIHSALAQLTPRGYAGGGENGAPIPVYRYADVDDLLNPHGEIVPETFLTEADALEEFGIHPFTVPAPVAGVRIVDGESVRLYRESDLIPGHRA